MPRLRERSAMKKKRVNLHLKSETIRTLSGRDLARVGGGAAPTYYCDSFTNPIASARCMTNDRNECVPPP